MTTTVLDSSTAHAMSGALADLGMTVVPADASAAISATIGSVLVAEGSRNAQSLPEAIVAFVDRSSASPDDAIAAAIGALTDIIDDMVFSEPTPIADIGTAVAAFPSISEAFMITEGSATVGIVLWIADRRNERPSANATANGADTNDPGANGSGGNTLRGSSSINGLAMLRDVVLDVSVELGRTDMTLADVMALHIGSVVELDRPAGSPVDVRVNGTLLARGEVVVIDGEYAVRISEVVDPEAIN